MSFALVSVLILLVKDSRRRLKAERDLSNGERQYDDEFLQEILGDARSPFKPPNDEEVFVTRETEKAKKKEAKE
jgi:hypothetical protein